MTCACVTGATIGRGNGHTGNLAAWDSPEAAGFSTQKLEEAEEYWSAIGPAVTSFIVVYEDKILLARGDIRHPYKCHSIRKSFLSALYGIHATAGRIDLNRTLAQLNIDDHPPLSNAEKQARVIHLLKSRSGVYHPAAGETEKMKRDRPVRGSHAPDTFLYYNNWDFNALGTIFEQETGTRIFEEFGARIAEPVGMQDYRAADGRYYRQEEYSTHPVYAFRMSARDRARFGLLYLREGRWGDRQIIPAAWITESTTACSEAGPANLGVGYGYMWIVFAKDAGIYDAVPAYRQMNQLRHHSFIMASGNGGHLIIVIPELKMVYVAVADTEDDIPPETVDGLLLLDRIIGARN